MSYCSTHGIEYSGYNCPRCEAQERHNEAQERHRELLHATEESLEETVDALLNSDYRRANPGDYPCPHCRYISLKNYASRCPLCHGEIGGNYWNAVRKVEKDEAEIAEAESKAEAERKVAREAAAAAEWIRTAPEREAAAIVEQQIRRNEASRKLAIKYGIIAFFASFVLTPILVPDKNLNFDLSANLISIIAITFVGAIIGAIIGQNKE